MLQLYPTVQAIIVITDGGSNFGGDPVQAALEANALGYTVSALGILDSDRPDSATFEIEKIGAAGGGVSESVSIRNFAAALNRVVRQTAEKRLSGIIDGQLRTLLAKQEELQLPGRTAEKLAEMTGRLLDTVYLRYVIAIDGSRSMETKLPWVKDGVLALLTSWQGRAGKSEMAVLSYPGQNGELTRLLTDFTSDWADLEKKLPEMLPGGGTPTAPAIRSAVRLLRCRPPATKSDRHRETGTGCL